MDSETVGVATIAVGLLLLIGAVRGTWKKLFQDVVLGAGSGAAVGPATGVGSNPEPNQPSGPTIPTTGYTCYDSSNRPYHSDIPCASLTLNPLYA